MNGIITENVIGILSALVLFIITEFVTRYIQERKDKQEIKNLKIEELKNQYEELVIRIAVTLENYAHYIGSSLLYENDTPDRVFNNYDNATKEIRLLAMEFSTFRIKIKDEDVRIQLIMPTFEEIHEVKQNLIGISNNMIRTQTDSEFERNRTAVLKIKELLKITI